MIRKIVAFLTVSIFFFAMMDILIWQRIFEAKNLIEVGIGTFHWGWTMALFGFISLGFIALLPTWKASLVYAVSLPLLAFSGLEDILYYWLDGKSLPTTLPWLNGFNIILFKPVTAENIILSALIWIIFVVLFIWFTLYRKTKSTNFLRLPHH